MADSGHYLGVGGLGGSSLPRNGLGTASGYTLSIGSLTFREGGPLVPPLVSANGSCRLQHVFMSASAARTVSLMSLKSVGNRNIGGEKDALDVSVTGKDVYSHSA